MTGFIPEGAPLETLVQGGEVPPGIAVCIREAVLVGTDGILSENAPS